MTFEESKSVARQLAENQLKKGFDVEAFLILMALEGNVKNIDLIPESHIDETLTDITGLLVKYFNNKTIKNLDILLSTVRQMMSELYHTCETNEEKQLFKGYFSDLSSITK